MGELRAAMAEKAGLGAGEIAQFVLPDGLTVLLQPPMPD
jgi:hypothetical protein